MRTNFSQAKSWILSAINDIKRVISSLKRKDFADVAFRSQFAVEKFNKAALNLLGVKIEKTHTPTKILKSIILDEEILINEKSVKENLLNIINYSGLFEDEGVKTRYGIFKEEMLMIPERIYSSFEDIKQFILNLQKIVDLYLIVWNETFNINEIEFKELKELKKLNKKLKKWI
ncbi:hypothetical protein LCGC14_2190890 [marine sediment metagenome]|uniref:HEPN domain-containing protein n=1 Tax=marine sediment metagenome TaxID=412755 RepID=A0A0F9E6N9_9ZZZZ